MRSPLRGACSRFGRYRMRRRSTPLRGCRPFAPDKQGDAPNGCDPIRTFMYLTRLAENGYLEIPKAVNGITYLKLHFFVSRLAIGLIAPQEAASALGRNAFCRQCRSDSAQLRALSPHTVEELFRGIQGGRVLRCAWIVAAFRIARSCLVFRAVRIATE